jgi:hypothetical protein
MNNVAGVAVLNSQDHRVLLCHLLIHISGRTGAVQTA